MRCLVVLMLLVARSAYAAEPYCALPTPSAMPVAETHLATSAVAQPVTRLSDAAPVPTGSTSSSQALPAALAGLPFVSHVLSNGATVSDLGASHGLHTISARHGDQFMIFQVTADGQAAVSGAMTDLTPAQLHVVAGDNVTELAVDHGLHGFFVRSGQQFQVFYATEDGQRLIPGVMYDATGKDVTRQQVAGIPGAIPTIEVGNAQQGSTAPGIAALPLVQKAASGTVGPSNAPHLWMLIDPQCIYSVRAYQALQPYITKGLLQISVIPLSVLDYEDQGQSTRSALALLSKPADEVVTAWKSGDVAGQPSPEAAGKLRGNMAIAEAIRLQGTPTFIWRKPDGAEGRVDGMPSNIDGLLASIGN